MRTIILLSFVALSISAQEFFLGADLSYVNEMEDCGTIYYDNGEGKPAYDIFADHGANLVRLRLWHTPSWYDTLNNGARYSDLADVKRSIAKAKAANLQVLLDFHLSDFWADPNRQIVPAAWAGVVDDLPILADSLYHYIHATLLELHAEDLAPELVQIGNETNKGILQSAEDDAAGWALDWPRNATLFNRAIAAVRDVGTMTDWDFKVAVHIAGPAEAEWLLTGFTENDVTDFDIIGLSYYWAWHQPTTIEQTGEILEQLRVSYPGKEVMIFETGYIWTTDANDSANNIINAVQPGYAPASPENQRRWLIDLTREVIDRGGLGVVYWEPAWVSTPCFTPWGQGSHQEHATFFDFNNHVLANGGMAFFSYPYTGISSVASPSAKTNSLFLNYLPSSLTLQLELRGDQRVNNGQVRIFNSAGQEILPRKGIAADTNFWSILLPQWPSGAYWVELQSNRKSIGRRAFIIP